MLLPPGTHKIEFRFEPASVVTGEKVALASSSLLLALVAALFLLEYRRKNSAT
jgi:hypothetical protein